MLRRFHLGLFSLLALAGVASATAPSKPGDSAWVTNAYVGRTAVLTVKAGSPSTNDGFNYNGVTDGEKGFVVPQGWRVVVKFRNLGDTIHTAIVVPAPKNDELKDSYPLSAAAFPGAARQIIVNAASPRLDVTLDFVAGTPGEYLILCGRLNHALNGQFLRFQVSKSAKYAEWKSFGDAKVGPPVSAKSGGCGGSADECCMTLG